MNTNVGYPDIVEPNRACELTESNFVTQNWLWDLVAVGDMGNYMNL